MNQSFLRHRDLPAAGRSEQTTEDARSRLEKAGIQWFIKYIPACLLQAGSAGMTAKHTIPACLQHAGLQNRRIPCLIRLMGAKPGHFEGIVAWVRPRMPNSFLTHLELKRTFFIANPLALPPPASIKCKKKYTNPSRNF